VSEYLASLGWFVFVLGGLIFLQRRLHLEIQAVLLLITRRVDLTITLFSVMFLPGVLVHEISHFLMAKLLGVRTGRISLLPQPLPNGRLQLGFVETAPTDLVRDVLIGSTPLIVGGAILLYRAVPIRLSELLERAINWKSKELAWRAAPTFWPK
jgi:hypothetical protein